MRVMCEPPIGRWVVGGPRGGPVGGGSAHEPAHRGALVRAVNDNAARLGAGRLSSGTSIVATGHQATLWHPGILAKDLAAGHAAGRHDAQPLHLVVDQDEYDPLAVEVPVRRGDRLGIERLQLASVQVGVPPSCQGPVDPVGVRSVCDGVRGEFGDALLVDLDAIVHAFEGAAGAVTLAEQAAVVVGKLREPYAGNLPLVFASQAAALPGFGSVLGRMLREARVCAVEYNAAAAAHPAAGVAPMTITPERVELPLWWLRWGRARQRVYADVAGGDAVLCTAGGERIRADVEEGGPLGDGAGRLAPRALLLTALMRRAWCDFFVHGAGGAGYDRVTDRWWAGWAGWAGEVLAPYAAVSADVTMGFDVPVSDGSGLARAVWRAHHLPHNVDRVLEAGSDVPPVVLEKRRLLAHMDDDRDRRRRADAFARIHAINRELAAEHREMIESARRAVGSARDGVANRRAALKRDWCFAFYDPADLRELSRGIGELA